MKWQAYPKYKDSGIEWLGEIPEHWEVIRVKTLEGNDTEVVQTGPFGAQLHASDYVDEGVPLVLIRNVVNLQIDDTNIPRITHEDAERLSTYRLEVGDIAFSRVGSIGRIALCTERERGWLISGQMLRLRIRNPKLNSRFSMHAFSSAAVLTFVALQSVGSTRESINTDILRNMPLPIPPSDEQRAIAAFLDRETERLDALIARKVQQIELLQEKRAALISHTVTKGLDPNAPMKDSGVEWLGEIPVHWEVVRLKYAFVLQRGFDLSSDKFADGCYPVCASNGIIGYHDQWTTEGPSITVGRSGSVGEVNFIEVNFWAHNTALYVKHFRRTHRKFTYYLLKTLDLKSLSAGTAVGTLNRNYIHDSLIPVPDFFEQEGIAEYLDRQTQRIDALIRKIHESITTLREHRTALISAAVTGKIQVQRTS